jgi:hypothetical protein
LEGKRLIASVLAPALAGGVLVVLSPPAHSHPCGYFTEWEEHDSWAHLSIFGFFDVDPFGGKREIAHYGHCTNDGSNVKVHVDTAQGGEELCLQPGDTRLGFTSMHKKISNAYAIGSC